MPLSSGLLRSQSRNVTPQCPPRVQVQWLRPASWTRVPDRALKVLVDQPDECHGWRIQCREPLQAMILHIPDENRLRRQDLIFYRFKNKEIFSRKERNFVPNDVGAKALIRFRVNNSEVAFAFWCYSCRCVDILELSELDDLLTFHNNTLLLYCSLCALGNTRVCHALCSHVDQSQILYAIQDPYLPGLLRSAFYQLLFQVTACWRLDNINWQKNKYVLVFGEYLNTFYCFCPQGFPQQLHHSLSYDEPWIHSSYDWPNQRNHPLSQSY